MQHTAIIVRAIGAEYIRRFTKPIMIAAVIAMVLLLSLGGWLTTVSNWWWLLQASFILLTIVMVVVVTLIRLLVRIADTAQTRQQKDAVNAYVDKLERIADNVQTPQPIILFRVIKDLLRPSPNGIIQSMSRDTKSLAPDYALLTRHF